MILANISVKSLHKTLRSVKRVINRRARWNPKAPSNIQLEELKFNIRDELASRSI